MTQFRAGVDELQVDSLQSRALSVHQQGLSQSDDALLGSNAASLDHDEVVVDLSVEWEAAHRCNRLVGDVVLGRCVVLDDLKTEDRNSQMVLEEVKRSQREGLSVLSFGNHVGIFRLTFKIFFGSLSKLSSLKQNSSSLGLPTQLTFPSLV